MGLATDSDDATATPETDADAGSGIADGQHGTTGDGKKYRRYRYQGMRLPTIPAPVPPMAVTLVSD